MRATERLEDLLCWPWKFLIRTSVGSSTVAGVRSSRSFWRTYQPVNNLPHALEARRSSFAGRGFDGADPEGQN